MIRRNIIPSLLILSLVTLCVLLAVFVKRNAVANPFWVGYAPSGNPDSAWTILPSCSLYVFPTPLQDITLKNFSDGPIEFQIGHGPMGRSQQANVGGTLVAKNDTFFQTIQEGVESMYFGNCP